MPSFYPPRQMASQMPLTPPDSGSGYGYSNMHYPQDPYAPQQSMSQSHHDASYDYQQPYMQPAAGPAPPSYQYSQSSYRPANSLPPIQSYYEPIGAPILPPLRIQDRMPYNDDYQRRLQQDHQMPATREHQRHAAKEEKATGGVSAKLDYDMERMTDFVTEATESIFNYSMQSPPSFRKWVLQVLSATRLPSATILLSLHYLNDRVAKYPETVAKGEDHIYRLLAVSLVLGSKFLDDNTFINKSWSDVTQIKVRELNQLEMKWLHLINYELHIDPTTTGGLQAWLDAWKEYDARAISKQQQSARLSPLDTTLHRHSPHRERYSPYPSPYSATPSRSYETPHSSRSSQYGSTSYPSSADLWAQSERHALANSYDRPPRYPTALDTERLDRRASIDRSRQSMYAYSNSAQPSYYQPPSYGTAWDQHGWNSIHRYDCACTSCAYQRHYRPYPMASSYTAQTVMG